MIPPAPGNACHTAGAPDCRPQVVDRQREQRLERGARAQHVRTAPVRVDDPLSPGEDHARACYRSALSVRSRTPRESGRPARHRFRDVDDELRRPDARACRSGCRAAPGFMKCRVDPPGALAAAPGRRRAGRTGHPERRIRGARDTTSQRRAGEHRAATARRATARARREWRRSHGQRSSSVSGMPACIFALFAGGWKSSASRNAQPRSAASRSPTVVLPDPVTPMTTMTTTRVVSR